MRPSCVLTSLLPWTLMPKWLAVTLELLAASPAADAATVLLQQSNVAKATAKARIIKALVYANFPTFRADHCSRYPQRPPKSGDFDLSSGEERTRVTVLAGWTPPGRHYRCRKAAASATSVIDRTDAAPVAGQNFSDRTRADRESWALYPDTLW